MPNNLPLVYSCSGCSNVAQMANSIALSMDRDGIAQMSCIAGVGGGVKSLVKTAKSGRPIIAIDGCALRCCAQCLQNHALSPDLHIELTKMTEVKKIYQQLCDEEETEKVKKKVYQLLNTLNTQ